MYPIKESLLLCDNCYDEVTKCDCDDTRTTHSDGIACPYCGNIMIADDAWFYSENEDTADCSECDKKITFIAEPLGYQWHAYKEDR